MKLTFAVSMGIDSTNEPVISGHFFKDITICGSHIVSRSINNVLFKLTHVTFVPYNKVQFKLKKKSYISLIFC